MAIDRDASQTTLDPNSPDWLEGYDDGVNSRPHAEGRDASYHDGWLTGDAERDAAPEWRGGRGFGPA